MAAPSGGGEVVNIVGGGQFPKILAKSLDDFEVGVTLGTGSFGRVRFATHKVWMQVFLSNCYIQETTTQWAIKILKKSEVIRLQQVEHIMSEKTILDQCKHPFIVHLACTFQGMLSIYVRDETNQCR